MGDCERVCGGFFWADGVKVRSFPISRNYCAIRSFECNSVEFTSNTPSDFAALIRRNCLRISLEVRNDGKFSWVSCFFNSDSQIRGDGVACAVADNERID